MEARAATGASAATLCADRAVLAHAAACRQSGRARAKPNIVALAREVRPSSGRLRVCLACGCAGGRVHVDQPLARAVAVGCGEGVVFGDESMFMTELLQTVLVACTCIIPYSTRQILPLQVGLPQHQNQLHLNLL